MWNKKLNNRKPDIWLKNHNLIIESDEGSHENYDSDGEKEREDMFKRHSFKIFRCTPNDPNFDIFKFLGEINLHISTWREENAENKAINRVNEDFKKIVAVTKLKELKQYVKNVLLNYNKKKHTIKKNLVKVGKQSGTTYCFGCKDYTKNFRPQEVKMINKVLREKSHCVVCRSNKSRFLKQKIN